MAHPENILKELQELNSSLQGAGKESLYHLPAGYFADLPGRILLRIHTMEAGMAEETAVLSPLVNEISRRMPYTVPEGYFNGLDKKLEQIMAGKNELNPGEELQELSPLLAGLKDKTTYRVPEGYFKNEPGIAAPVVEPQPAARVVPITGRTWFRFAAAAVIIGFVATIGFFMLRKDATNMESTEKSFAWVKQSMKKVSTDDITEFVELAGAGAVDVVKTTARDAIINDLLKDVSDKEIQQFLNETQSSEDDDLILN